MNYAKLREITSPSKRARLEARYGTQLAELRRLGFRKVAPHYDYAPPYYFIGSFFQVFLMFLVKEEWCFAWPFTHATLTTLDYHPGTATYAKLFGLGGMFYNQLPDGSIYITASWGGDERRNEQARVFKRYDQAVDCHLLENLQQESRRPSPLAGVWRRHLDWIGRAQTDLVKPGYEPSLVDFERISLVENIALHQDV